MTGPLQIRNVPSEVRRTLKTRAAARGESLNSYVLELLAREAAQPTVAEVLERASRRAERAQESVVDTLNRVRAEREEQLAAGSTS